MLAFSAERYSIPEHSEEAWILDSGASMHMTFRLSRDVNFVECSSPEERQNFTEITFEQKEKEQSILPQKEVQGQYNVPQESSSDEDSMMSIENSDDSYHPPRSNYLEQEEQRNITLRPRQKNKVEPDQLSKFQLDTTKHLKQTPYENKTTHLPHPEHPHLSLRAVSRAPLTRC
ncbi:unnamed protein product, partial [Brenthis ino]